MADMIGCAEKAVVVLEEPQDANKRSISMTTSPYKRFGLTLMLTHRCNLKCDYCYGGESVDRVLPLEYGTKGIDRAIRSLGPDGSLELGFFGGEPLLEPELFSALIVYAVDQAKPAGVTLAMSVTTNGTVTNDSAWTILMRDDIDVSISLDGRPVTHDRHRKDAAGCPTSSVVLSTLNRLMDAGKAVRVVTVVSPDNVSTIDEDVLFLQQLGIRRIQLSLNLLAEWTQNDMELLHQAVIRCAPIWAKRLPDYRIDWFDNPFTRLCGHYDPEWFDCGFGKGDIAVSPAGHLYPCERLIHQDEDDNPMRMDGHVLNGNNFLFGPRSCTRQADACSECTIESLCNTKCGCCNYTRSGNPATPDRLLCLFNQWCIEETRKQFDPVS